MRHLSVLSFCAIIVNFVVIASPFAARELSGTLAPNSPEGDLLTVPDTAKIDNDVLKKYNADKFITLWFIHVLSKSVVTSKEPWTLIIPQNSGLPKGKDVTLDLLLSHAVLGMAFTEDRIKKDQLIKPMLLLSIADTVLTFSKHNDKLFVNNIPVIQVIKVGESVIYIIDEYIPFSNKSPDQKQIENEQPKVNKNLPKPIYPAMIQKTENFESNTANKITENPNPEELIIQTPSTELPSPATPDFVPKAPFAFKSNEHRSSETPEISTQTLTTESTKNEKIGDTFRKPVDLASLFSIITSTETSIVSSEQPTKSSIPIDLFTSSTTPPLKETNIITNNGIRPTRFDKFKKKQRHNLKGKSLSSVNSENIVPSTESTPLVIKDEKLTTSNIPIIDNDIDSEFLKHYDELENLVFEAELGSGDIEIGGEKIPASTFIASLDAELTSNHGTSEFMRHFNDSNLKGFFEDGAEYTGLIPSDMAFYSYYPIDWGFNPFQVPSFTRDVILNHFVKGVHDFETIQTKKVLTTLGGKHIIISRDNNGTLLANDQEITKESQIDIVNGKLYHLHQLLFVDSERVSDLKKEYPYLETAPLLGSPWPTSQFLSHLLLHVGSKKEETTLFAEYLNLTNVAHLAPSADENLDSQAYTAFVPTNNAIYSMLFSDGPDVFNVDLELREKLILNSIVKGRYKTSDLVDGTILQTLADTNLTVSVWPDGLYLDGVKVIIPEDFIYNLGSIFRVQKLIGITEEEIKKSIEAHPESPPIWKGPNMPNQSDGHFEVRTEISVSKRINDGEEIPVLDLNEVPQFPNTTSSEQVTVQESVTVSDFKNEFTEGNNFTSPVPFTTEKKNSQSDLVLPHLRGEMPAAL